MTPAAGITPVLRLGTMASCRVLFLFIYQSDRMMQIL